MSVDNKGYHVSVDDKGYHVIYEEVQLLALAGNHLEFIVWI